MRSLAAARNSIGEATGLLHKQHRYFGGCLLVLWKSKTGNGRKSPVKSEFPEIIMKGANTCKHKVTIFIGNLTHHNIEW